MGPLDDEQAARYGFTDWENAKIASIARRFPGVPAAEMTSQLRLRLTELKSRPPPNIRHWKAYRATSLRHEASRFARKWRSWHARELSPTQFKEAEEEIGERQESPFGAEVPNEDRHIAFREAWDKLAPELRVFWLLLERTGGNQVQAAKLAGIHRNTARLWRKKIRAVLREHGLA